MILSYYILVYTLIINNKYLVNIIISFDTCRYFLPIMAAKLGKDKGKEKEIMDGINTTDECSVCMQKYTKTTRVRVKLPCCGDEMCINCIYTYFITNTLVLICPSYKCDMEIQLSWVQNILGMFKYRKFMDIRNKHILDIQKPSIIAKHQDKANKYKSLTDTVDINSVNVQYKTLLNEINDLYTIIKAKETELYKLKVLKAEYRSYTTKSKIPANIVNAVSDGINKGVVSYVLYHCPETDCRGMVVDNGDCHQCGLCKIVTCKKCREIVADDHKCDKNIIKNIDKLTNGNTKACPRCKVLIFKIQGCNQMYCTNCNTPFEWDTGKIYNGNMTFFHNPHMVRNKTMNNNYNQLIKLHASVYNAYISLNEYLEKYFRTHSNIIDMEAYHISYLCGELSENDWVKAYTKQTIEYEIANKLNNIQPDIVNIINKINKDTSDLLLKHKLSISSYCKSDFNYELFDKVINIIVTALLECEDKLGNVLACYSRKSPRLVNIWFKELINLLNVHKNRCQYCKDDVLYNRILKLKDNATV